MFMAPRGPQGPKLEAHVPVSFLEDPAPLPGYNEPSGQQSLISHLGSVCLV